MLIGLRHCLPSRNLIGAPRLSVCLYPGFPFCPILTFPVAGQSWNPSVRKLGEGGQMVRVRWSDEAEADLAAINPAAVRDQIRNSAEEILHPISLDADPEEE